MIYIGRYVTVPCLIVTFIHWLDYLLSFRCLLVNCRSGNCTTTKQTDPIYNRIPPWIGISRGVSCKLLIRGTKCYITILNVRFMTQCLHLIGRESCQSVIPPLCTTPIIHTTKYVSTLQYFLWYMYVEQEKAFLYRYWKE